MVYSFAVDYAAQDIINIRLWLSYARRQMMSTEERYIIAFCAVLLVVWFFMLFPGAWNIWGIIVAVSAAGVIGCVFSKYSLLSRVIEHTYDKSMLHKYQKYYSCLRNYPQKVNIDLSGISSYSEFCMVWIAWTHVESVQEFNNIIIINYADGTVGYIPMRCIKTAYGNEAKDVVQYIKERIDRDSEAVTHNMCGIVIVNIAVAPTKTGV